MIVEMLHVYTNNAAFVEFAVFFVRVAGAVIFIFHAQMSANPSGLSMTMVTFRMDVTYVYLDRR